MAETVSIDQKLPLRDIDGLKKIMDTMLTELKTLEKSLSQAPTIVEVKNLRDQAEALRQCTKLAGQGLEMQNYVAEIKIRIERRAGEMLEELVSPNGGRPPNLDTMSRFSRPTLADLGISYHHSKRWRLMAKIPLEIFNHHIEKVKSTKQELTTAGILRLAKQLLRKKEKQEDLQANYNHSDYLYKDQWITLWDGDTEYPDLIIDHAVAIIVTNGSISRRYILETTEGFSLTLEENQQGSSRD